ncbi:MAG: hypothetical protein GY754_01020 [bacterium]|nr:hypothetical protein [bacterium]
MKKVIFKPRARLLLQLGDQLIRNESIAVLELVKNAYDADANKVKIVMNNVDDPDIGEIVIEDDGTGMDIDIIENIWMEPGNEHKSKLFKSRIKTAKYKRLPLGEKGIGRFGVHKLGYEVKIISKKENAKEVYFHIDWEQFEEAGYLKDLPIKIYDRDAEIFTGNKTGTKIIIKRLRNQWDKKNVRDLYRAINTLNSPFEQPGSFRIEFKIDNKDWIKGLKSFSDIKKYSLFHAEATLAKDKIKNLSYSFTPWETMHGIEPRKLKYTNIKMEINEKDSETGKKTKNKKVLDLSQYKIGEIKLELLMFDRDSTILALGVDDKTGLKMYLEQNGGIRVFRDGLRIYDYGEPGNDWLELDSKRINSPSETFSNNLVIGSVNISRDSSEDLNEKTNREGFIENEAFYLFQEVLLFAISQIGIERHIDKTTLREKFGRINTAEPVTHNISELKKKIKRKIKDEKLRKELNNIVARIDEEFRYVKEIYLYSSAAGLNLSIVIHEIEKLIYELNIAITKQKTSMKIIKIAKHLANLIETYSDLIKHSSKKTEKLNDIIDNAIFAVEYRLEAHKIEFEDEYKKKIMPIKFKCSKNLLISSIMNIVDNSIYWLNYYKVRKKKIYLDIVKYHEGYISLIIADNGKGFTLSVEAMIKPLVSGRREGERGMGLGLHIVSEVIKIHEGILEFPDYNDLEIPDDYKNGAIIMLSFKVAK